MQNFKQVANTYKNKAAHQTALSQMVRQALQEYFKELDGQTPVDLHAMVLAAVEIPLLEVVLNETSGNKSKTAEFLGINRGTLSKKLRDYKLSD